jgi:hypothetical protein
MRTLITTLRWRKHVGVTVKVLPTPEQLRSEECRAKAAECQEIADRWPDLLKSEYGKMARQWLTLAEQTERQSQERQ